MRRALTVACLLAATPALADEGMWTFNNFPADKVKKAYGFQPTDQWLQHVQLSSARLAGGCSGSFVSAQGLVLTNHHCARRCIDDVSTPQRDYIKNGFWAAAQEDELQCPTVEINRLEMVWDVTELVNQATMGLEGAAFHDAQKEIYARVEKSCATSDDVRCDVVNLHHGGMYHLYKYRRFQDVRLVFAPEHSVAFFGGDPDNFEYPRYDYDVSFLRVYVDGKPAPTGHFFKWSAAGAQPGMLTFVTGHPGGTSRLDPTGLLRYQRDYALPERLTRIAEMRGLVTMFQALGPEQARISNNLRFGLENGFKALKGRREALADDAFLAQKEAEQKALQDKARARKDLAPLVKTAWSSVDKAAARLREIRVALRNLEQGAGSGSQLFNFARALLRAGDELPKPNEKRLPEFSDAKLPALRQMLTSPVPIYPDLEQLTLTFYLSKLREELGPDHPVVRRVLGAKSPEELAKELVKATKLSDHNVRRSLLAGGKDAVDAANDAMIELARATDGDARAIRKLYENEVDSVVTKNTEAIAKARFSIYGASTYPDATFTLRLSYGSVKGYVEDGKAVEPMTTFEGLYQRATGREPFELPPSWVMAKDRLDPRTPMNFCTTNDIIGGNSGSPVINKDAEVVGVIFDGNIQSLGGEYGFDPAVNRAVALDSRAIVEGLDRVYGAHRLVRELRGN